MSTNKEIIIQPGQDIVIDTGINSQVIASCINVNGKPVLTVTSLHKTDDPINGRNRFSSSVTLQKGTIWGTNSPELTIQIGETGEQSD